ncbi:DUF5615 family PIN-like protein [Phormidesmis priestleyi]|uniref:DUF5615 family PIN-like protein n=1 Tax=Phormidesmis priestleyi TaxID=268141 RepID=UPI0031451309
MKRGTLWTYAQHHDFIIVWIRRGNCSTRDIETMLRSHFDTIQSLNENPNAGILTLF